MSLFRLNSFTALATSKTGSEKFYSDDVALRRSVLCSGWLQLTSSNWKTASRFLSDKETMFYFISDYLLSDLFSSLFNSSRTSSCSTWNTFPRLCILTIGNPFWSVQTFMNSFTSIFPFALGSRQIFSETKYKPTSQSLNVFNDIEVSNLLWEQVIVG